MSRPLEYETIEDLQNAAEKYFNSCKPELLTTQDKDGKTVFAVNSAGKPIVIQNRPTITGLAYALGFESRQSFYDYEKRDIFSYTIKRLRLRIEMDYEKGLRERGNAGDIFGLKNFAWRDKQEFEHSGEITTKTIDLTKLTKQELEDLEKLTAKLES